MSDERNYIKLAPSLDIAGAVLWKNMLTTYGLYVIDKDIYKIPERSHSLIDVPGSNGSYAVDDGYYKNIDIWYDLGYTGTTTTIPSLMDSLSAFFAGSSYSGKYFSVTDSYSPLLFRKAILKGELNVLQSLKSTGTMRINLSCKPYRYYLSGYTHATISSTPISFINPSSETAYPLLYFTPTGENTTITLTIGSAIYVVDAALESSMILDCEKKILYSFYTGAVLNDWYTSETFPSIPTGTSAISITGATNTSWIMPRWYTL